MHQSIATIDSPEFINLQPLELNPLMSKCEIKVLYIGENRNRSFITKEVATEMSKTLRGAPIVGYYKESKGDFADHGEKVVFDDEGIHFECMTRPYGFVSPDAQVWFQKFEDLDDFGNSVEREYLMTTGYLWTGQYEECADVLASGKPHSMELDEETVQGNWSTNVKSGMEFFIINDAIFSKLCILGDDVEPCFEGSSVTAPEVSKTFSLDNDFKKTLYTMMQDLQNVVSKGGQQMDNIENTAVAEENVVTDAEAEFTEAQDNVSETEIVENQITTEGTPTEVEVPEAASEFKKEDEEKEEDESSEDESEQDEDEEKDKKPETKSACASDKDDADDDKKNYALLESQYNELQAQYSALEAQYNELVAFKASIEDAKKEELIGSFTMLSEEEKKDIVENKSKYSYEEIDAKLSMMFAHKQIAAAAEEKEADNSTEDIITTFNLNSSNVDSLPDWLKAVKETEEKMNY